MTRPLDAINSFCAASLALGGAMTAAHYAVVGLIKRYRVKPVPLQVPPVALMLAPPAEAPKFCAAAGAEWLAQARVLAARICAERGQCTADDIWNEFRPPENVDGRLLGPVFATKDFVKVGEQPSERGNNNNRYIAVWRRREDVAA